MKKQRLYIITCCQVAGILIYYIVLTQKRNLDFRLKSFNIVTRENSTNVTIGTLWNYSAYNLRRNENINSSIKFVYSEAAITQYAAAIHNAARNYVDVGSGQCIKRLPQCIIIGNYKSGTRELIDFMSMHPRIKILSKPMYEVDFFNKFYPRGLEWYRRRMPCSYSNQITVVKTPSCFQSASAPSRIHKMNSSIKLIALFREPLSRTLSHFTFNKYGLRYKYDLKVAVTDKRKGGINKNSYFIKHSIYDEGLARYLDYFDRNQIKMIEITDFKRDPYKILYDLEEFLNLEHTIRLQNIVFNKEKGYYCLRKDNESKTAACYQSDRGRNSSDSRKMIKASPELIEKLKAFFKPHNENFFRLLGRAFDW